MLFVKNRNNYFLILNFVFPYFISNDRGKAIEILTKDLKVFQSRNEEVFKELTQLLTFNNIRYIKYLSCWGMVV